MDISFTCSAPVNIAVIKVWFVCWFVVVYLFFEKYWGKRDEGNMLSIMRCYLVLYTQH